jgi:MoaA/NifB/PqqE/SkfB family radical SAM enzyme
LITKYGVNVTFITGGEPTLHPELPEIIAEIYKTGTSITLITNGTHLHRVFDRIKNHVHAFMFSLDGSSASLHSNIRGLANFAEIISWPAKIKAANPSAQVAFSCLLQKDNIGDIVDLYRLLSSIEYDALFFNVPEMKPRCFGRGLTVPAEIARYALLNDRELETLELNLEKIQDFDYLKGKCHQGEEFFNDCIEYFKFLQGKSTDCPDRVCDIPFSSLVIDESGNLSPCFYLPFSLPAAGLSIPAGEEFVSSAADKTAIEDIVNHGYLKTIRQEIQNNIKFRDKYCRHCLQFQG